MPRRGDGDKHLRRRAERRAREVARRHADDRQRLAVDDERVVQNVRIGAEPRQPPRVAEHGDGRFADRTVVAWTEQPAERGLHAEHRKVASRDEHALAAQCLPAVGEVGAEQAVRRDSRKGRLHAFKVPEHRIAEDDIAVAGLVARLRTGLGAWRGEVDQPGGLLNRQRSKDELVEQRKDRRIRSDSQRQRHDGDDRHKRALEERPERELEVQHEGIDGICGGMVY